MSKVMVGAGQVAIAAFYVVLQRIVLRGLGLFSTLVLVRLLSPNDFGVVAVASSLYTILDMLMVTGFGMALVRMRDPRIEHYDTVFTLTLLRNLTLAVLLVAFSGIQGSIMGDQRITPVIWVLAGSVVVQSFESVRLIDFERSLRFGTLLHYGVMSKVLGIAISLPLAWWLRDYWALVLGGPLGRLITVPYSYRLAPYRPRLSIRAWRELFGFSKWLMFGNLCLVADSQLLNLIIGRINGVAAVGFYQVGYQIAALPISEIAAPIRAPLYSGFSRVYHDIAELRKQFISSLELQWLLILPLSAGVAITSHEVIALFLGEKWAVLAPLMPIIAMFGLIDSFCVYAQMIFIVLNRQAPMVLSYAVLIAIRATAIACGAFTYGIQGAAWAVLITGVLNILAWLIQVAPLLHLRVGGLAAVLWRGAVAAGTMCIVVSMVPSDIATWFGFGAWPVATEFLCKVTIGALTYCSMVFGLWIVARAPASSAEAHILRVGTTALGRAFGTLSLRRGVV